MTALLDAALEVSRWLADQRIPACLIGGLAVQRWGEPRLTQDVDLTVLAPYGDEEPLIDACLRRFAARVGDARAFALDRRVLLLEASNGVSLDLALGASGFEAESIERATPYEFAAGYVLPTCSAEDLIIHKAVAGRPRDLADIERVVTRQWRRLDLERIRHWLRIFADLKEDPETLTTFEAIVKSTERRHETRR